jgi:ribonuclease HI
MCINGYSDSFVFVKELQKLKKNKKKTRKKRSQSVKNAYLFAKNLKFGLQNKNN